MYFAVDDRAAAVVDNEPVRGVEPCRCLCIVHIARKLNPGDPRHHRPYGLIVTKYTDSFRQLVIQTYISGKSLTETAAAHGLPHHTTAQRWVTEAGVIRPHSEAIRLGWDGRRTKRPEAEIVDAYARDESEKALAERYGVSRNVIRAVLLRNGVAPRNRSAGMYARMRQTPAEERLALAAAAHDAVRGAKQTDEHRGKTAKTLEARGNANISAKEIQLAGMLEARGIVVARQTAVGRYNVDLTLPSIAVEVCGGNWLFAEGRRNGRYCRKIMDLGKAGWHVIIAQLGTLGGKTISDRLVDELVAFAQFAGRNPSAPREYRVIGGDGKTYLAGRTDDDQITLVWPTRQRPNAVTGRYESVARKAVGM